MPEFTKPLDEWVDESKEVDVPVVSADDKGNPIVKIEKKTVTERVMYQKVSPQKASCKPKTHDYEIRNRQTFEAKCKNCMKSKFLNPTVNTIRDGHIIIRDTGVIVD